MTIAGTNISTFGLKLLRLENYYDLPARKKLLDEQKFLANDIKYEVRKPKVTMFGSYTSQAEMAAQIALFIEWLKLTLVQEVAITEHGLTFNATFADGMQTTVYRKKIKVELTMTIQEI
jgi:hypothetical protein